MEIDKNLKKGKNKKIRVSNKPIDIKKTNKYKHEEIRKALIGMAKIYFPKSKNDMESIGIDNWFKICVEHGS